MKLNISKPKTIWALFLIVCLLFVSSIGADDVSDQKEPIKNLEFQSADVRSVLTFLSDYGNVNVVVAPEVNGTVTIKLSNIHWRTAMDIIGRTYNLAVVDEDEGYIRVLPAKVYRTELTEMEQHRKQQRDLVALETKIVKIANSTSNDVVNAVKSLLTDRGKASSDPRSNSVIIQEVPSNLQNVLAYITELDRPSQQIKISTRLLELSNSSFEEIGVDWSGTIAGSGDVEPVTWSMNNNRATDNSLRIQTGLLGTDYSIDALLDFFVRENKGRIIAHPEITTVDNKEARIQMGQKIPVKQFDESGNVVIKFEEVGTILTVTPHITADNQILMELAPERSTYEFDPNGIIINTSNAQTNVIVNNGQTAVIGGLTTEDELETEIGVPILKDIPLLGRLFKYTNKRLETRDLVIFVTPTIVDNNLAMAE